MQKNQSNLCREYRKRFPDMPTLKLARIIYAENNLRFRDIEAVRNILRYIEGKTGERQRKCIKKTEFFMAENRPKNPYNLPESYEERRDPFILPVCCNNILLISDLHIPYHNIDAVTLALDYGKKEKVNTIEMGSQLSSDLNSLLNGPYGKKIIIELFKWFNFNKNNKFAEVVNDIYIKVKEGKWTGKFI